MLLITFLYEISIINGTTNSPVDSAISYIFKISPNKVDLMDSIVVKNGTLKLEIKDTSTKMIGIETRYKGYSFYSPILNIPIKSETLFVYEVSNDGSYNIKDYSAFVINQDSLIMIAEEILISTDSKNAIIPKEPIKLKLPNNFSNFQYNGLPQDSVQVIGNEVIIKPFIIPRVNNVVNFVYIVNKNLKLERNFGNINYTVAIRKDLKHNVKNLTKADVQKMGNIDIQLYRGNKPPIIEAGVALKFDMFGLIDKYRYVFAGIFVLIIVLIILLLQRKKGNEVNSKENKQEDQQ
ncbi:MAG: hypothetical protein ABIL52_05740 [candidate division WOR-3 bacterium]